MTGPDVNPEQIRTLAALRLFPPSVTESLLSDPEFTGDCGIGVDCKISFTSPRIYFVRSELHNAIRTFFRDHDARPEISDSSGTPFALRGEQHGGHWTLRLEACDISFPLPDFAFLSPRSDERIACLQRLCGETNIAPTLRDRFGRILHDRPLSDTEAEELDRAVDATPVRVVRAIMQRLQQPRISIEGIVPRTAEYYVNLIGPPSSAEHLEGWMLSSAGPHLRRFVDWNPVEGLCFALAASTIPAIAKSLPADQIDEPALIEVLTWLRKQGDRASQVAAVEYCLAQATLGPDLTALLTDILSQIRDDDVDDAASRLRLISSICMLVYGDISLTGTLRGFPVYWRRRAAMAHASLLERCLVAAGVDVSSFCDRTMHLRGQFYYFQGLADLRTEPFWIPDHIAPRQLKNALLGRVLRAARLSEQRIDDPALRQLLLGDEPSSLASHGDEALQLLPLPLDGSLEGRPPLPPDWAAGAVEQLRNPASYANPFAALINMAAVFRVELALAEMAASILVSQEYRVHPETPEHPQVTTLFGLATVAASTRSAELAQAVRVATWQLHQLPDADISADDLLRIGVVTAAAHPELEDWALAVGEWFKRISFSELDRESATSVLSHLRCLCQIEPELWATCGPAEAALLALVDGPVSKSGPRE